MEGKGDQLMWLTRARCMMLLRVSCGLMGTIKGNMWLEKT